MLPILKPGLHHIALQALQYHMDCLPVFPRPAVQGLPRAGPAEGGGYLISMPLVHYIAVLLSAVWDKGQWGVKGPTCRRVLTTSAGWVHQAARAALPAEQMAMPQPGNCPASLNCTAQHACWSHSAEHKHRDAKTYTYIIIYFHIRIHICPGVYMYIPGQPGCTDQLKSPKAYVTSCL